MPAVPGWRFDAAYGTSPPQWGAVGISVFTDCLHGKPGRERYSEFMSFFVSARERWLWCWALAVLVAAYSSMGSARWAAAWLRQHGVLTETFTAVLVIGAAVLVWRWSQRRPGVREVAVGVAVGIGFLMAGARIDSPEERTHLIEYGSLAALTHQALKERRRGGRTVPAPAVTALIAVCLLGWLDEAIQAFLPNRVYDLRDVGFNTLAVVMMVAGSVVLSKARHWDLARRRNRSS